MLAAELRLFATGAQAVVEQVGAMPGQGVSSMFAFGQAFGLALGVLAGLGVATVTVTPAAWKRDLRLCAGKDAARLRAAQLWPAQAAEFRRVRDDGRAEAALLAHWLRGRARA